MDEWLHYALLPVVLTSVKQVGDLHAFLGDLHAVSLHTQSTPDAFKVILHPNVPCASVSIQRALFKGVFVREPVSVHRTLLFGFIIWI